MKILLVSPFFAPYSLVGAHRINSLADFLIKRKHDVTVLAFSTDYYRAIRQDTVKAEIPQGVRVVRFDVNPNIVKVSARNKSFSNAFYRCTDNLLKQAQFDIALASLGPFFTLKMFPLLSKKYHLPYVLDYRDLNSLEALKKTTSISKQMKAAVMKLHDYHIDRKAINSAEAVVTVTEYGKQKLTNGFRISNEKVHVVLNGFDDRQLNCLPIIEWTPDASISIGYFGKFMYYDFQLGANILKAITNLRKKGLSVKLYHIGPENPNIPRIINAEGIDIESYEYLGSKSYSEGIAYLKKMICCAIEWNNSYGYGTKVFDYIYVNKPIIASVVKTTELASFLSQFKNAFVSESVSDIENAIVQISKNCFSLLDDNEDMLTYSRTNQNMMFEQLLERYSKKNA